MNTFRVMKRAVIHPFRIAGQDEIINTREGAVAARAGDVIVTGVAGEVWPVQAHKFAASYEVLDANTCRKQPLLVLAVQMECPFGVSVSWQESEIRGEPGDWLLEYGAGDYGVVGREIFAETYDILGSADQALDFMSHWVHVETGSA